MTYGMTCATRTLCTSCKEGAGQPQYLTEIDHILPILNDVWNDVCDTHNIQIMYEGAEETQYLTEINYILPNLWRKEWRVWHPQYSGHAKEQKRLNILLKFTTYSLYSVTYRMTYGVTCVTPTIYRSCKEGAAGKPKTKITHRTEINHILLLLIFCDVKNHVWDDVRNVHTMLIIGRDKRASISSWN